MPKSSTQAGFIPLIAILLLAVIVGSGVIVITKLNVQKPPDNSSGQFIKQVEQSLTPLPQITNPSKKLEGVKTSSAISPTTIPTQPTNSPQNKSEQNSPTDNPTNTPTPPSQATYTPTPTLAPSKTPTTTPTPSSIPTSTHTPTPLPTSTPTATPTPSTPLWVNTKSVNVTFNRSNLTGGAWQLFGEGFTIYSNTATEFQLEWRNGTAGTGFTETGGSLTPGTSRQIRSYITPGNLSNGTYTGSYLLKYKTSGSYSYSSFAVINFSITLTD